MCFLIYVLHVLCVFSVQQGPIAEQPEVVTGGTNKSPKKECRSSTKEAATFSSTRFCIMLVLVGLVFIGSFFVFPVLQEPSSDQTTVARNRVEEEVRKGSKGETVSLKIVNASLHTYATAVSSLVGGYRCSIRLKPRYLILSK